MLTDCAHHTILSPQPLVEPLGCSEIFDLAACRLHARLRWGKLELQLLSPSGSVLTAFTRTNNTLRVLALLFYRKLLAQHIESYAGLEWRTRQELCSDHGVPASRPKARPNAPPKYTQIHQYITPLNAQVQTCFDSPQSCRLIESRKDPEGTFEYRVGVTLLSVEPGAQFLPVLQHLHTLYLAATKAENS